MKKIFCALLLAMPLTSTAAIVDYGTYFQDTDTGLYWLKLTETLDQSYDEVEAQFTVGQPLEGWRFAKLEELESFIAAYGIPNKGKVCNFGNYCDGVDPIHAETIEDLIRLFGDTYDAYLDETNDPVDVAPDGAGTSFGYLGQRGDVPGTLYYQHVYSARFRDHELVDRITGLPAYDGNDQIVIGASHLPGGPSFLVRLTDPTIPQDDPNDPNTLQLTVFDNLAPEDFGMSVDCLLCNYDANSWTAAAVLDYTGTWIFGDFYLVVTTFDEDARPWVRITGYDYKGPGCEPGDTGLADGWCRKDLSTAEFSLTPSAGGIPGGFIDHGDGFALDNLDLEFIHSNIQIDYDPWNSANTVRPKAAYFTTVGVKTLSTFDGDPIDFDAGQIDPATVKLGPARTPNIALPVAQDFDGDGDTDMVFGFRVEDSGIGCLDTSVTLVAKTFAGEPLAGQASISPIECEETIDIDVDPFNPVNTIRPNDSYNVTVAVLGMRVADGDAVDVTPGTGTADDIDPTTLRFGPAATGNSGTPIITDINGDTRDDLLVSFNAYDAGIACADTELEVTGAKVSGIPVEAMDSIVTEDCDTGTCHP